MQAQIPTISHLTLGNILQKPPHYMLQDLTVSESCNASWFFAFGSVVTEKWWLQQSPEVVTAEVVTATELYYRIWIWIEIN